MKAIDYKYGVQEVAGSNPVAPTIFKCPSPQLVRAFFFPCNSRMIMSGFSKIEMSGLRRATMFHYQGEGGHCGWKGQ